jgi:tetratricopeptide (TPR) repeat protein
MALALQEAAIIFLQLRKMASNKPSASSNNNINNKVRSQLRTLTIYPDDMKKNFTYLVLLVIFFGATAFVVLRYNGKKGNGFYPLKERNQVLAKATEWNAVKKKGEDLMAKVRYDPRDHKSALALAGLYIQEARITGDYTYYDEAALHYLERVLEDEDKNFEALTLKAILQLSQHHFTEAIETANKAKSINPHNAYVYGLLVDGYVETGNYAAAVENADRMVSIRPDLRSYSRIAYLREIHGDYPGAIEAMQMAVDAGAYGDEPTAWVRTQLARLFEMTGDMKSAEMHYTIALNERPGYAHALAGLGNIALAKNDVQKAIDQYLKADSIVHDYAFKEKLAELYRLTGQTSKSDEAIRSIIDQLKNAAGEGEGSADHHSDRELAFVYLMDNKNAQALQHALAEYRRRPENIDVQELLGWAYYKNGKTVKGAALLEQAMRTGSKNPALLCRAGIVYAHAGDNAKAKIILEQAMMNPAHVDPMLWKETKETINRL